jgi:hypothetical protein
MKQSVSVLNAHWVIIIFAHKLLVITFHEFIKNIHVQGIIIDVHVSVFLVLLFLLGQHVLQWGLKQFFAVWFGYHVGIFIIILLGRDATSWIVTFFATRVELDCLQMVNVAIAYSAATSAASSTTSTTSGSIIALATTIVIVSISHTQ